MEKYRDEVRDPFFNNVELLKGLAKGSNRRRFEVFILHNDVKILAITGARPHDSRPVFIRTVRGHITKVNVKIGDRVQVEPLHSAYLWHTTKAEAIQSIASRV